VTQPESTEVAKLLGGKLIERRDAKAIQFANGGYTPARVDRRDTESALLPWKLADLVDHVERRTTYGHYVVSTEGTCRMFAFDIDLRKKAKPDTDDPVVMFRGEEIDARAVWAGPKSECRQDLAVQLRCMAQGLAEQIKKSLDIQVLVSYSGCKGMHVYGVIDHGTPAAEARELARLVMDSMVVPLVPEHGKNFFRHESEYPALSIEVFPKQDDIKPDGFGNLLRLPLGMNQKSGKAGFFVDLATPITKTGIDNPLTALTLGSIR
jgi:hypothetical protein